MEIAGYIGAIIMGMVLGMIGGGGSILTVPILVYLFHVSPVLAAAYSLFIVGITSVFGAWQYFRQGKVNLRAAILFGLPSIIAVYLTRKFLVPALPDQLFELGQVMFTKDMGVMVLLALLMVVTSFSMIRSGKRTEEDCDAEPSKKGGYHWVLLEGVVVGMLTGLVGAGGGFLIVPALVLFSGLSMRVAVGTSLVIVSLKSLIGFLGDLGGAYEIDWQLLAIFSLLAIVGIFSGNWIAKYIPGQKLKPIFGWFVLVMGFIIIINEIFSYEIL